MAEQLIDVDLQPSQASYKSFENFFKKIENNEFDVKADFSGAEKEAKQFVKETEKVIENGLGDSLKSFENESKGIFANISDSVKGNFDNIIAGFAGGAGFGLIAEGFGFIAGSVGDAYENANQFRNALLDIQAKTGATSQEMEGLQKAAEAAFLGGVGESLTDAVGVIGEAQTLLGDTFNSEQLGDFTAKAQALGNLFDKDVNEVISKATPFIKQFGLTSDEAFNLLAKGLREGKTPSDDLLDTFAEYSQLASKAGFSAAEFTGILTTGAEKGIFNLDKLADAIKETEIRLKAGDISKALGELAGENKFEKDLLQQIKDIEQLGVQGKKSVQEVLQESNKIINDAFVDGKITETLASNLQVALSGTPAEDIGTKLFGEIFSAPLDEAAINASAAAIGSQVANAVGQYNPFDQFTRQAELFVTTFGKGFIDVALSATSFLAENFDKIAIAIGVATVAVGGYILVTQASAIASSIATTATAAWNAVLALNPAVAIALGIAALTVGVLALVDALNVSTQEQLESNQAQLEQLEQQKSLNREQKEAEQNNLKLIKRYEELGKKSELTADEQKEFRQAQLKLAETYPGVIKGTADFSENLANLQKQADKTRDKVKGLDDQYNKLSETQKKLQKENLKLQIQLAEEEAFESFEGFLGLGGGRLKQLFNKGKNQITKQWNEAGLNDVELSVRSDAFDQLQRLGADPKEIAAFQAGLEKIVEIQRQRIVANGGVLESEKQINDELKDIPPPKPDPTKDIKPKTLDELINQLAQLRIKTDDLNNATAAQRREYDRILNQAQNLVKENKNLENSTKNVKFELGLLNEEADKFLKFIKDSQDKIVDIEFNLKLDELNRQVAKVGDLVNEELNLEGLDYSEAIQSTKEYFDNLKLLRQQQLKATIQQIEQQANIESIQRNKQFEKEKKDVENRFDEQIKLAKSEGREVLDLEEQKANELTAINQKYNRDIENAAADKAQKVLDIEKENKRKLLEDEKKQADEEKKIRDKRQQDIIDSVSAIGGEYGAIAEGLTQQFFKLDELLNASGENWTDYASIVSNSLAAISQSSALNAEAQKALAVSQAVINTALAVTKVLPNIPLSILIGALGAAQIATILGAEDGVVGLTSSYNKKPGKTDTLPFLLAPGESVINSKATAINKPFLEYANKGGDLGALFGGMASKIDITNERLVSLEKAMYKAKFSKQSFNLVVENKNNSKISGAVRV